MLKSFYANVKKRAPIFNKIPKNGRSTCANVRFTLYYIVTILYHSGGVCPSVIPISCTDWVCTFPWIGEGGPLAVEEVDIVFAKRTINELRIRRNAAASQIFTAYLLSLVFMFALTFHAIVTAFERT